jgi:hypothetical protein
MDKIQEIYKKYNRPGAQNLFQLAKNEGLQITLKQVQEFFCYWFLVEVESTGIPSVLINCLSSHSS